MARRYYLVDELGRLIVLESRGFPPKIWTECTVRKEHNCIVCDGKIVIGQRAHRPITNGNNRMHRICPDCILKIRGANRQ